MRPVLDRAVDKIEVTDDCWIWTGARNKAGYGQMRDEDARMVMAHRAVWEAVVGPIPTGLHLDHLCRNHSCVNPDHLEPVTPLENHRRGVGNAAKTHCPRGHAYDVHWKHGRRCRECRNAQKRERKRR